MNDPVDLDEVNNYYSEIYSTGQVEITSSPFEVQQPLGLLDIVENQGEDPVTKNKFYSEYERNILSVMLKSPMRLAEFRHKMGEEHFLYEPNKIIFRSVCSLLEDPEVKKIDLSSLHLECKKNGLETQEIGPQYLSVLYQSFADEDNFDFYVGKVSNAYEKYKLNETLKKELDRVAKNSEDLDRSLTGKDLINSALSSITKLNLTLDLDTTIVNMGQRAEFYVQERAANPKDIVGLPTGIRSLDLAINGLLPGTLTIVGGRAKAGKSALLMNILEYLTVPDVKKHFEPVKALIISTEMYTDEDISRLVAMNSYIEERKIANGQAYKDPEEREVIKASLEQIKKAELYHVYLPYFNAEEVCSIMSYCKLRYNIGLAVFDYIKMETSSLDENKNKREDQVLGDIANALKMSAGRLNIPVITGCQINNNTGRIADSDRLVRYANTIIEFRAKDKEELEEQQPREKYGTHWLTITHCRSGGNKKIPVSFYKPCLKILEADKFKSEDEEDKVEVQELVSPRKHAKIVNAMFANSVVNSKPVNQTPIINNINDKVDSVYDENGKLREEHF